MARTRKILAALALSSAALIGGGAHAAGEAPEIARQEWTFGGMTGYFDRAQLQRGFKVYNEVCAACHGMNRMYFRNLGEPGGPEFSEAQVEAIAASKEVQDGPNDDGEMFTRPGKPSDRFPPRWKNAKEAAAANNGAVPPDLSLMAKARTAYREAPWYLVPVNMAVDVATQYQEQGPDYLYALLTGYVDPPADMKMGENMNYNAAYPGHQIAMANPLSDGVVSYGDGTPETVDNYARDVTAFMMWAAEPKLEERKKLGLKVLLYLVILSVLLYLSKKVIWSRAGHSDVAPEK
jgi:cytochrome c1